ncbi:hypothetical protein CHARACLAT_008660 [Characodon lateralis]|uniref:Uncharacterized protein n=1 Tax=Characodon lateralis TaxID=208331 RepID=A0ABU7F1C5_9TELE|nr:hypothetical protein [Characodon lateralis]
MVVYVHIFSVSIYLTEHLGLCEMLPVHHYASSPRCMSRAQQNIPDDKLQHTSHRPLLSPTRFTFLLSLTQTKHLYGAFLSFKSCFPVKSFLPAELPFPRPDRLDALTVYLLYSCL